MRYKQISKSLCDHTYSLYRGQKYIQRNCRPYYIYRTGILKSIFVYLKEPTGTYFLAMSLDLILADLVLVFDISRILYFIISCTGI